MEATQIIITKITVHYKHRRCRNILWSFRNRRPVLMKNGFSTTMVGHQRIPRNRVSLQRSPDQRSMQWNANPKFTRKRDKSQVGYNQMCTPTNKKENPHCATQCIPSTLKRKRRNVIHTFHSKIQNQESRELILRKEICFKQRAKTNSSSQQRNCWHMHTTLHKNAEFHRNSVAFVSTWTADKTRATIEFIDGDKQHTITPKWKKYIRWHSWLYLAATSTLQHPEMLTTHTHTHTHHCTLSLWCNNRTCV